MRGWIRITDKSQHWPGKRPIKRNVLPKSIKDEESNAHTDVHMYSNIQKIRLLDSSGVMPINSN